MGVGSFDYDDDGWPDVFVSNDAMENHLFHNTGDGAFKEMGAISGIHLRALTPANSDDLRNVTMRKRCSLETDLLWQVCRPYFAHARDT